MSKIIVVDPFDYVVFGGTGDLAKRKLFPALYHRELDGQLPDDARIIGVARSALTSEEFRGQVEAGLREFVPASDLDDALIAKFIARFFYQSNDAFTVGGYKKLKETLDEYPDRVRVIYLATPPSLFGPVSAFLAEVGLNGPRDRLVLEKPLGHDLASSQEINADVAKAFDEDHVYRIDHYLGKESVQNLMALRFGNVLFESIWSNAVVDHVQITVAEDIGAGDRAAYYSKSGALRDMVQNHLAQLLCLTAMEAPASMDADSVRDEKLKVLRSLRPFTAQDLKTDVVRGQYAAGAIGGESVPGYATELGEPTKTETYVALKAHVDNWRWAGVPFYLRTGKRLPVRSSEIVIRFKAIPHSIFRPYTTDEATPNRLVIRLQPDEGVSLRLMTKDPGPGGMRLRAASLDLSFKDEFELERFPDAYERLLLDVVRGNRTLFMRRDELEAAWQWVTPILDHWAASDEEPKPYQSGSWGPTAAAMMMDRDGRSWHEDMK